MTEPSRGRLAGAMILIPTLVLAAACATTGATFRSGVGDAFPEHPPYYAGAPATEVAADTARIGHLPVVYQRGASQAAVFDPKSGPGTPVGALLAEMNAYLDSLGTASGVSVRLVEGGRVSAVTHAATTAPPDVRFGCITATGAAGDDCAERGDSALVYNVGGSEIEIEVNEWANDRIMAKLRGEMASGSVSVKRAFWFFHWPSSEAPLVIPEKGLPSKPFGYLVPAQAGSPWPSFRRNLRNTGQSPLPAAYSGDAPWSFRTGKGVLASPVIDEQGVIYFGSADHTFYAVNPNGTERWRYRTGGVIDAAAALLRPDNAVDSATVVVGSADGFVYRQ
jgi:hypothetical protein